TPRKKGTNFATTSPKRPAPSDRPAPSHNKTRTTAAGGLRLPPPLCWGAVGLPLHDGWARFAARIWAESHHELDAGRTKGVAASQEARRIGHSGRQPRQLSPEPKELLCLPKLRNGLQDHPRGWIWGSMTSLPPRPSTRSCLDGITSPATKRPGVTCWPNWTDKQLPDSAPNRIPTCQPSGP